MKGLKIAGVLALLLLLILIWTGATTAAADIVLTVGHGAAKFAVNLGEFFRKLAS